MTALTTRLIYLVDALGSALLGIALVMLAGPLSAILGPALPQAALMAVGIGLLPWAVFNFWIGRQGTYPRRAAALNVAGDFAWIVASIVLVTMAPLTATGAWIVSILAALVLLICLTKASGLARRPVLA